MKTQPKTIWHDVKKSFHEAFVEVRSFARAFVMQLPPQARLWLGRFGKAAVGVTALTVVAGAIAIYGLGWENRFTREVSRVVPFPAVISWRGVVSYHEYANEVERIKVFLKQTNTQLPDADRNRQAIGQRLNVMALRGLAQKKKITVTPQELTKEYNRIVEAYGGEERTLDTLKKEYGIGKNTYRELIREQLLQQKTESAWASDSAALGEAKEQASAILRQASDGTDFNELAGRYSQDQTANGSGDEALMDVSTLPENVLRATEGVKDGELVARPIEVDNSYYLIKRIKTVEGKIMVRGIVIKPLSFGRRLAAELDSAYPVKLIWAAW